MNADPYASLVGRPFAALARLALPLLVATGVQAAVKDTDWCVIETPDSASPGTSIEIRVTLKPGAVQPGEKLANHLHWMKKDGFGGMLSWVPHQDVGKPTVYVFRHAPTLDATMHTISPLVFLSPDGDYAHLTKRATGASIRVVMDPVADAAALAEAERRKRPPSATFKRSALRIEARSPVVGAGDTFEIAVHYTLAPEDNWGDGTRVRLMPLGPWIDNPDGKYTTTRHHVGYPGLATRTAAVAPGTGTEVFRYTMGRTFTYNDISWMATFIGGDGRDWPWSIRGGGFEIRRTPEPFDLVVPRPGGLFTYDETPTVRIVWGKGVPAGTKRTVAFSLTDANGDLAGAFTRELVAEAPGKTTDIALADIQARGVLLVEAEMADVATREAFLARIPDLPKQLGSRRTPFGATNLGDADTSGIARKLGLSHGRHFVNWQDIEPLPGQWRLADLERTVDANNAAGLRPWICLVKPPSWIIPGDLHGAGFEPFPFHPDLWRQSAETLARTFKGRIWGFEWLNEIVPGKLSAEPEKDYRDFCRIGTEAVRRIAPEMKIQLAGGLWPRNFRTDLLNGGVGAFIDVLPVHYSNETGIREARHDADSAGLQASVEIWDNETASGLSIWNMPAKENLARSAVQSKWVMRRWPAELIAGAKSITYFGGSPQAAGNWTYLLDKTTPRPVAATLAVLSSKIGLARPVATAYVEPGAVLHLFDADGAGVAIAATVADTDGASATLRLPVGAPSIHVTDNQGNVRKVPTAAGVLTIELSPMPVFLEGFDPVTLTAQAGLIIGGGSAAPSPTLTVVKGSDAAFVDLRVCNPLAQPVKGSVAVSLASGVVFPEHAFELAPGDSRLIRLPLALATIPAGASLSSDGTARLVWTAPVKVAVDKPFKLLAMDPRELGNLLENGDMERLSGTRPAGWSGNAEAFDLASLKMLPGPGLTGQAARFTGETSQGYQHASQTIPITAPGRKYLYTAWVWNHDMQAGSNLAIDDKTYYIPAVFDAGQSTKFWRLLTHIRATPDTATSMGLTPVVRGKGWAMYDNIRVSLYDGTDFAAGAPRTTKKIVVDGSLDDWDLSDPIPLLCDNQITAQPDYAWTPQNLSGVAKFAWDADALYLAAWVRDDKHVADATGEDTVKGDCLVVALHPENRADGTDAKAFQWYVGAASPGGGSGVHTLYRPALHSGGLQAGQLAKDSSVYEVSIKRTGDLTTYELRIPWAETGGLTPSVGVKAGLSLQLNDKDDSGATGVMTWGGGLKPTWSPSGFGALTLIE